MSKLCILYLLYFWSFCECAYFDDQPKILIDSGNIVIESAVDRNVTFRLKGVKSHLNVNGLDLLLNNRGSKDPSIEHRLLALETRLPLSSTEWSLPFGVRPYSQRRLVSRIEALEERINTDQSASLNITSINRRLRTLESRFNRLLARLNTDNCTSNPCRNGGSCRNTFDGYVCQCPDTWTGNECGEDVNECAIYAGTTLGCQNSAICENTMGGYNCRCTPGWQGIHCTQRTVDCLASSSNELCGHGTCVHTNDPRSYRCICDQGWKTDGVSPACMVDINECELSMPHCSVEPQVQCINLPGTYTCGHCPPGYSGNGHYCRDIDECEWNNGGCSTSPFVQCINIRGSSKCAACPYGYTGDGRFCIRSLPDTVAPTNSSSNTNTNQLYPRCGPNNICHPSAVCYQMPTNIMCVCPPLHEGNGIGPNGCIRSNSSYNTCASNPCENGGTCINDGLFGFHCECPPETVLPLCSRSTSACSPNPCQSGGTCVTLALQDPIIPLHPMLGRSTLRGYRCLCPVGRTGRHCQSQARTCGGVLDSYNGTLRYPSSNSTYLHNSRCAWLIKTDENKVLNITFTMFNVENSTDCRFDWLQIHDGRSSASHMIGRFCGTRLPNGGNIISTTNLLYLWFRSDNQTALDGFALNWTTIDPTCGGEINALSHGTIASPGSPGRYPPNRDCIWKLSAPPNKQIQLHFYTMQLESHETCQYDYLAIYNGLSTEGQILEKFCNTSHPEPLSSSSNELTLQFHSDGDSSDMGFQIHYTVVDGIPGCGGTFTAASGEISSANRDGSYMKNIDCRYLIKIPMDSRMKITFSLFKLEAGAECGFDYVEMYEGRNENAPKIGRWCGERAPLPHISLGNEILIVFHTDWSYESDGFRLKYETICGGDFDEENGGTIQSPWYPRPYEDGKSCVFNIIAPLGKAIVLNFTDFDIEDECDFDSLSLYDGVDSNATRIGQYCGSSIPPPAVSTQNHMHILFNTDISISGRGFKANYSFIDSGCGGVLKKANQTISPPLSANGYLHGTHCRWTIMAPPNQIIELSFSSFDVEHYTGCFLDYLAVYENVVRNENDSLPIGKFCGTTIPSMIASTTQALTLFFKTDESISGQGFVATYRFVDGRDSCGGRFYTANGVITSPRFPNNYLPNANCVYNVRVPSGKQIQLKVKTFELEHSSSCSYDYLEIRNGPTDKSPLIGKFCGTEIPPRIDSISNQLYMVFKSDYSDQPKGFEIEYSSAISGCGGVFRNTLSGTISSPNYPEPYSADMQCDYRIQVSHGSTITLFFTDIDMESMLGCHFDHISIYDGFDSSAKLLGSYCRLEQIQHLESSSNALFIRMITDSSNEGRGFEMRFSTNCKHELLDQRGIIESPNYPKEYAHNSDCEWKIKPPLGNRVFLEFSNMELETSGHEKCQFDKVTIEERDSSDVVVRSDSYCDEIPKPINTTNTVVIKFVSDYSNAMSGFHLEYEIQGCGGIFRAPVGHFTSPNYPNPYQHDLRCQWAIEVEYGELVVIEFKDFDFEASTNCAPDGLTITADKNSTEVISKFCGSINNKTGIVTSRDNKVYVNFHSDMSYAGKGFSADYHTIPSKCGGVFTLPQGNINSQNYPKNYESNSRCEWLLQTEDSHSIILQFTDFDIERSDNCTKDVVRIYDGVSSTNSSILFTSCGNMVNSNITGFNNRPLKSSSNSMLVVFESDDAFESKGFSAQYSMSCGSRIQANGQGSLQIGHNLRWLADKCEWVIQAVNENQHVTLNIQHIENEPVFQKYLAKLSNDSSAIYMRKINIYDGPSSSSPKIAEVTSSKHPPTIVSEGDALTIAFDEVSDQDFAFTFDFEATYSTIDSKCGGDFNSISGEIASPGYPRTYKNNIECIWTIAASVGNAMILSINMLDIDQTEHCNADYLEIRETNENGKLVGVFCGTSIPAIRPRANKLWIKFNSDNNGVGRGFLLEYNYVQLNELTGNSGIITSMRYPSFLYYANDPYSWRITVDPGNVIDITLVDCMLKRESKIQIYDGYDSSSESLVTMRPDETPTETITSTSNIVFIELDILTFSETRFKLKWNQISKASSVLSDKPQDTLNCTQNSVISVGKTDYFALTSPGWPSGYESGLDCVWTFVPAADAVGYHVYSRFRVVDLEPTPDCISDYVKVGVGSDLQTFNETANICSISFGLHSSYHGLPNLRFTFHSDYLYNRSGFDSVIALDCGGVIEATSGDITSDMVVRLGNTSFPVSYLSRTCTWLLKVKPGRTIKLQFTQLNETSSDCRRYFFIRNGPHEDSPYLGKGKYCGTSDDLGYSIPQSGSNQVLIQYSRELGSGLSKPNFTLHYEQVEYDCGRNIILDRHSRQSAIITTPNYPNIPDPHIECIWRVSVPNGDLLRFEFIERFDLTFSTECTSEYVEIREGSTTQSPVIGTFCGEMPRPIITTSNYARLSYFTDVAVPRNGFKVNVSIAQCGKSISGRSGVISSPGYPGKGSYPKDASCDYYITSLRSTILNLTFTDLDLPIAPDCSTVDHLEIYSMVKEYNSNETEVMITKVCGSTIPQSILSYNSKVHIRFKTTSGNHLNRGFQLRFQSTRDSCQENIETSSGIITSPGYPIGQITVRVCEWTITVPKGRRIKLEVLDFDVRTNQQTMYELAFYNDLSRYSRIAYIRNETDINGAIYSTDNRMRIRSAIRSNSGHRGFKLKFTSDELTTCIGNLNGINGTLAGPANATSFSCEYTRATNQPFFDSIQNRGTIAFKIIEKPINESVCLPITFTGINFEFLPNEIGVLYSKCPRKYENIASPYPSTKMSLRKVPIGSFELAYQIHNCGGRLNVSNDLYVTQPSFSAGYGEVDCAYYYETSTSRKLQLTVTSSAFDCEKTYVNVYAGATSRHPRTYRLCGNARNNETIAAIDGRKLFITYHSDTYNPNDLFRIKIDELDGVCGGELRAPRYTFSSPRNGTNSKYPANIECEWFIYAHAGNHIGIYFPNRFQLEMSTNCNKDSFQIHEKVNGTWTEMERLCGRDLPNYWNSTSNEVKVVFRTDGDGDGDGFVARWSEECGGVFRASQEIQTIVSPRYPQSYPRNSDCTYSIRAKQGESITVKFLDFALEDSTLTCRYDNVTITKYSYGSVMENVGTYCSSNMLPVIRHQSRIDIAFKSDAYLERRGFKFVYHTDQCGGNITTSTRIQNTIGLNESEYLSDSNCIWYITAPTNQRVVVRLERLEIEQMYQCYADFFDVYEGHTLDATTRKIRLCGNLTRHAPSINIESNKAAVKFFTDSSMNKGGFSAEILFVKNCNRNIELNSSQPVYMLDNLSGAYEPLQDCEYFVKAPEGHLIVADFKQLHLAPCETTATNNASCTCDYLQIRDGGGPFAELLGTFCGHNNPDTTQSTDRHMYLRFVTDLVAQSSGFKVEFRMIESPCGQMNHEFNDTYKSVTIRSPSNSPGGNYMPNLDCKWRFSSSLYEAIRFRFKNFDVEDDPSGNCNLDYLEIHDDETKHYITEGLGESTVYYGTSKSKEQSFSQGKSTLTAAHRYCGTHDHVVYYSQYPTVYVRFKSNEIIERSGFEFTAQTFQECERSFIALQGRVITQAVLDCETTIEVPENYTISIYYSATNIYAPECQENHTIARIYNNRNDEVLQTFTCNADNPRALFAPTNKLKIKYLLAQANFDFTYLATDKGLGCGGELFNYGGQFTSPGYPNVIRNNTECTWIINVPINLRVALRFLVFDMGSKATCPQNYLEIIESDEAAPTKFCGDDNPAPYKARSNRVSVHTKSATNFAGTGWVIEFMAVHENTELVDF